MQILHPFVGSIQQYAERISDPNQDRPQHCPQCQTRQPLCAHGFYDRTLVDVDFEGAIRVRRFLCLGCKRTVSLLPQFALPYLRFSVSVICQFLFVRLLEDSTLKAAAVAAAQAGMPYQRGQFWIRRFRQQAAGLCAAWRADRRHARRGLPHPRPADAASHRRHRGAPLPVWRLADAPVGLAAVSGSGRASRQPAARRGSRLSANTQHLLAGNAAAGYLRAQGDSPDGYPKPKKSPCSVTP